MADAYKTLYRGQLGNTVATVYTAPSAVIIKHITVVNNDSSTRTFQTGRNGTTAAFFSSPLISLKAGEMAEWDGTMALESGGTLAAGASVAAVLTMIIDGDEVT